MDSGEFDVEQLVSLLRDAAHAVRSVTTSPADEIRAIHRAVNALQAREADLLAVMDETKAHEAEGAASIKTWAVREIQQDVGTTRQLVAASKTMRDLPAFGSAARRGELSFSHVNAMTFALKHVGHDEISDVENPLLSVAAACTPGELFNAMRQLKAVRHEDELDEAWLRGMDKEDFQVVKVGDGYQPKGFFGIDLGAKISVWLRSASAPRDGDDTRTAAERRIDALNELVGRTLEAGLPAEGNVKPHISVIVEAEKLKNTLQGETTPLDLDSEPAVLEGFGPIGSALLTYLVCGGDITPILVEGFVENSKVLDVGRSKRVATKRQRRAIHLRQHGRCANRGCHHPIGEAHHVIDWAYGGTTSLKNLVGLCRKCHALITLGRLHMTGTFETGYSFSTSRAGPLARTG